METSLKIYPEFKNLIRPLTNHEYLQLETNLKKYGCRNPICVWNDFIIDGHNRYEICRKHNIPFEIKTMDFEFKEEAIAWICANQLGQRNLSEASRKYLIGRQYESEKIVLAKRSPKNPLGHNQYTKKELLSSENRIKTKRDTAHRIAEENHISHGTVEKYAEFTRALDSIDKKAPELVPKILSGKYKVSHDSILELSKLPSKQIESISMNLERTKLPFQPYQSTRKEIKTAYEASLNGKTIKDMPVYDPDSEITALTLTIPSWKSSIFRVQSNTDFEQITNDARSKLKSELIELLNAINELMQNTLED